MLLDRIDIDAHGPLNRVEIGPLSEHLNVLLSPEGAGKTAIARFIRDSLVDREYPLGMMSSSTGRVVWADRNGMVHCRREQDGSPHGRRTIEFETRGEYPLRYENLRESWVSGAGRSGDARMSLKSIQLPESIVDGVITDTHNTNVIRVVSACIRSGLDCQDTYDGLPLHGDSSLGERGESGFRGYAYHELGSTDPMGGDHRHDRASEHQRRLRTELADIEAELARLDTNRPENAAGETVLDGTDESLVARRRVLHQRLARWEADRVAGYPGYRPHDPVDLDPGRTEEAHHWRQRLAELHTRADSLRQTQAELRRWIDAIDADARPFAEHRGYSRWTSRWNADLRTRIADIDAQIVHLRRTLVEVRGLKVTMNYAATWSRSASDATSCDPRFGDLHDADSRHSDPRYGDPLRRVDAFAEALDRYDPSRGWDRFYSDAYRPMPSADIEMRINAATRQIDWLLSHYDAASPIAADWYRNAPVYRPVTGGTDLGTRPSSVGGILETLRAIRHDLQTAIRPVHEASCVVNHHCAADLDHCEHWLSGAIDRLAGHRESLLRQFKPETELVGHPAGPGDPYHYGDLDSSYYRHPNWYHERSIRSEEYHRVTTALENCLNEAAKLRASLRRLPVVETMAASPPDHRQYESIVSELRQIDAALSSRSRAGWLQNRRREILARLGALVRSTGNRSPLAEAASRWLVRLSAGRLRNISWNPAARRHLPQGRSHYDSGVASREAWDLGIRIDSRDERDCVETDRAIAALAVRLAAADLLARTGRAIPLVIETPSDWIGGHAVPNGSDGLAYREHGDDGRSNSSLASALFDYVRTGRQILLLTSDARLADQAARTGARLFRLHAQRTTHSHRPVWRPQYEAESYVGPHPHTCGYPGDHVPATDQAADGTVHRDGFYYRDQYTTVQTPLDARQVSADVVSTDGSRSLRRSPRGFEDGHETVDSESPFFLTVDSPIDQAPSIDAVAAARLRGLGITHVNHLMQQDSNRLADSLGLGNTNAATIRRWQAECRLVCRVPQLRGFDARVLVGCGITDPAQLAAIHPDALLVRVQSFLATERGQRILLSGSSYELSRITSWIASANRSVNDSIGGVVIDGRRVGARNIREDATDSFDQERYEDGRPDSDGYEYRRDAQGRQIRRRRVLRQVAANGKGAGADVGSGRGNGSGTGVGRANPGSGRGSGSGSGSGSGKGYARRRRSSGLSGSNRNRDERSTIQRDVVRMDRDSGEESRTYTRSERPPREDREPRESADTTRELRFYLKRDDDVVDAPSIGPRMAERLNRQGIDTVDDLLNADPADVAEGLNHKRIDADTVTAWQQQATLVCRVPMMRGHDAQLLVAAEVTTPEDLATWEPEDLFALVDPVSRGAEGKRILRGGALPDLAEITEWIRYGRQHRSLMAA